MLRWNNLSKAYGRRRLFAHVSGELREGEGVVVTGANGSGKSTFLKLLAGLVRPDDGQVFRPEDRRLIGYAAPHLSAYGELSALENLLFQAELRGVRLASGEAAMLLGAFGLERAASKRAAVYSTGMAQRLRLACAIVHDPPLLLLDEPTIGLDAAGVTLVEQIVAGRIAGRGSAGWRGAAIIATNDPGQCARFKQEGWSVLALGG